MAGRCGSISRSLLAAVRSSSTSKALPRLRPSPSIHGAHSRSSFFTIPRTTRTGAVACMESLLPLHRTAAAAGVSTRFFAIKMRAFCELSQGT